MSINVCSHWPLAQQEMSNELQVQDTQIERLPTRAVKVNDDLNRLNKTIAKI